MTCGDKLWSFHTPFRHSDTVVSDGTQRQIMVILRLLSSRGGEPDDMREPFGLALFHLLSSRGGGLDDMREPFGPAFFTFFHLEAAGPMTCGNHLVPHFSPFVI